LDHQTLLKTGSFTFASCFASIITISSRRSIDELEHNINRLIAQRRSGARFLPEVLIYANSTL
jgi:hypothetical protein